MYKFAEQFNQLLSDILPPDTRLEDAQKLTPLIREHLHNDDGIVTVEPGSRLIGSYPCHTAIASVRDMKDVDVLLFLEEAYLEQVPSTVLQSLKATLKTFEGIERIELTNQRRSIQVYLTDYEFFLDIVPCVLTGTCRPSEHCRTTNG